MLKKVLPLLSITEFDFSVYNYFESLKKPQNIVVDDVLRLLAIFNIKHLTNLLLQILNEFEPFNGEILIYGSALTHLLDSKTSSLPPNDIDILVLSNTRNLSYSTFFTQPKFLDVINYQQSYNFPFETIKVTGNPSVDINFFLRDKSEYNLKELGRVLGNNQAIYLFKENGKLKVQFKRVFEHQSDLDILNPYSRGLKFLKIRLDQHIESLSTLFDIHKFLTKNIRYYNKKYQLESVKTKYKFHIDKCLEFINCYSDIKSVSCEDIQFDFETFKTNLVTFKSKFPRTTGLPSNLDILILLLDAYLIKFCYLIELVSSPSLHSYKSLNDSDLATEDMSISTIQSEEYFPNKFDSEHETISMVSSNSIESDEHISNKSLESELDSSGSTSKESDEEIHAVPTGEASSSENLTTKVIPPSTVFLSKNSLDLMHEGSTTTGESQEEISENKSKQIVQKPMSSNQKYKKRKRKRKEVNTSVENTVSKPNLIDEDEDSRSSLKSSLYEKFKWCLDLDYRPYLAYLPQVSTFRKVLTPAVSNLNNRLFLTHYDSSFFNSNDILINFSEKDPMLDHFKDILDILNFHQKQISNIKNLNNFSMIIFLICSIANIMVPHENGNNYLKPGLFLLLAFGIYRTRSFIPKEMQFFNRQDCELQIKSIFDFKKSKKRFNLFSNEQKEYLVRVQEKMHSLNLFTKTYCPETGETNNKFLM